MVVHNHNSILNLRPGDRVLFRDGDRYLIARVDLVRERYYTAFPYCPVRRQWLTMRRRIARDFVLARVEPTADVTELVKRIECLRNQRETKRQIANDWLRRRVLELLPQEELADA